MKEFNWIAVIKSSSVNMCWGSRKKFFFIGPAPYAIPGPPPPPRAHHPPGPGPYRVKEYFTAILLELIWRWMLRCKTDIKFYQFPIRVHFSAGKMKIIGVYSGKCNNESEKKTLLRIRKFFWGSDPASTTWSATLH